MNNAIHRGLRRAGLLSLILCAGCIVSEVPFAEPEEAMDASGLIGSWENRVQKNDEVDSTLMVFEKPDASWPKHTLKVSTKTHLNDGTIQRGRTIGFMVKMGQDEYIHFLNLKLETFEDFDYSAWRKKEKSEFLIFSIRRTDQAFELYAVDQKKLETLIGKDARETLDSDDVMKLRDFLRKEGPESMFQQKVSMKFDRQKDRASDE